MIKEKITDAIEWHKDYVEDFQDKYDINDYTYLWIAFSKGVLLTLLLHSFLRLLQFVRRKKTSNFIFTKYCKLT